MSRHTYRHNILPNRKKIYIMAAVIMIAAISAFPFAQPSKQYHDLVNTDTRQLIVKVEKWLQK